MVDMLVKERFRLFINAFSNDEIIEACRQASFLDKDLAIAMLNAYTDMIRYELEYQTISSNELLVKFHDTYRACHDKFVSSF